MIVKSIENSTMYNMQELLLQFVELILIKLVSSIFSINLSINLFLHNSHGLNYLQFSRSRDSLKSQFLSHSHLQLLRFQIYHLSHIPLSINSLHSH